MGPVEKQSQGQEEEREVVRKDGEFPSWFTLIPRFLSLPARHRCFSWVGGVSGTSADGRTRTHGSLPLLRCP